MRRINRRAFLRKLAFGGSALNVGVSSQDEKRCTSASETHTLVCIFLRGGADTLNMVIPYADDAYYKVRPTLAIAAPGAKRPGAGLRLDDHYAFHPKMKPLLNPFADGNMLIVQGVGSDNSSGSHFEAQDQLEHGESGGQKLGGGWLGRHLRAKGGRMTPLSAVSLGRSIPEALRGAPCASALMSIEDVELKPPQGNLQSVAEALSKLYSTDIDLLGQAGRGTLDLLNRVEKLKRTTYRPSGQSPYPDSELACALKEVARLVKADVGLEVACIDHDNWDTHFFQGGVDGPQASNIADLSLGLSAFYSDIKGELDRVSILVMTEFGRRVYENSSMGTDHGRGFAMFIIGGKIRGGRVIGDIPRLNDLRGEDSLQSLVGPSGLAVGIDYRSVLAALICQLLDNQNVEAVFPGYKPQAVELI